MIKQSARRAPLFGAAVLTVVATMVLPGVHAAASSGPSVSVIVREYPGSTVAPEAIAASVGGQVTNLLSIIHGFSARVPASALSRLSTAPGVLSVSADSRGHLLGTYDPTADTGSALTAEQRIGARAAWSAGYTGAGVDIALIDSGVVPVDGLTTPGKILNGPDFSLESSAPNLRYLDTFGHGTHMAGIIAGRDNSATAPYAGDTTSFLGVAPDARIVNLKVADAQGNTDVSQILIAIDWVVRHRTDHGMNIRVLNLSYGTDASQDYAVDPLAYATEVAWQAGIVVVAAAGNSGTGSGLTDPAYDPTILAVGAATAPATTDAPLSSDSVTRFSNALSTASRNADLVAPGSHVQSLRDPGSFIDQTRQATGAITSRFFRGSGTSMATAMVSGAAALLIDEHPDITPDQVKALLTNTAVPVGGAAYAQGSGELNIGSAIAQDVPTDVQQNPASTGLGTLDGSRGTARLRLNGDAVRGDEDVFGQSLTAQELVLSEAGNRTALDSTWLSGSWRASGWVSSAQQGTWQQWSGDRWSANWWSHWWTARGWVSASWSSASWSSASWSSASWSASGYSSASWSQETWA